MKCSLYLIVSPKSIVGSPLRPNPFAPISCPVFASFANWVYFLSLPHHFLQQEYPSLIACLLHPYSCQFAPECRDFGLAPMERIYQMGGSYFEGFDFVDYVHLANH